MADLPASHVVPDQGHSPIVTWSISVHSMFREVVLPSNGMGCYLPVSHQELFTSKSSIFKEYLHLLLERPKWHTSQRNVCISDIVLAMDNSRNAWTMAKVVGITKDKKRLVRIVQVKKRACVFELPVHKLTMLLESELNEYS